MAGSIDPRCETIRGTHWPKQGRVVVWSSRRGNHLGQRSKAPHQQAGHMDASDPIRPSKKLLWHGGRPHMARGPSTYGSLLSQGRQGNYLPPFHSLVILAISAVTASRIADGVREKRGA